MKEGENLISTTDNLIKQNLFDQYRLARLSDLLINLLLSNILAS